MHSLSGSLLSSQILWSVPIICVSFSFSLSGFVVILCSRLCAKAKAQGQGCGYDFLFSVTAEDTGLPLTRLFASHSSPCLHASNSTLPLSLPTSLFSFPSPTRMDSEGEEGGGWSWWYHVTASAGPWDPMN